MCFLSFGALTELKTGVCFLLVFFLYQIAGKKNRFKRKCFSNGCSGGIDLIDTIQGQLARLSVRVEATYV